MKKLIFAALLIFILGVPLIPGAREVAPTLNAFSFQNGFETTLAPTLTAIETESEPNSAVVKTVDFALVTHTQADLLEQDVFLESRDNSDQVMRVKGATATHPTNLVQQVYASAVQTEHDLLELGPNPLGPFAKGTALGFTLYEWLAGTGSGTYTLDGNQATLDVTFQNLVPNGVYSAWCGRQVSAPNFVVVDFPCGAIDGSQNVFQADERGDASFKVTMNPLPASNDDYVADIVFAYHSENKTYGSSPGKFGQNSHVQLFVEEPLTEAIEFMTQVTAELPEQDVFIANNLKCAGVASVQTRL